MLYSVTGTVQKLAIPCVAVDVHGVGYLVTVPSPVWDSLQSNDTATLILHTYVREDRLDLFGFLTADDRSLFVELLNLSGIGPKTALEICSIPRSLLIMAVTEDDVGSLTKIKGVGKKTAEKLLVDLKQLYEKHPEWAVTSSKTLSTNAVYDDDAISALATLGYERSTIIEALKRLPKTMTKTEERVTAVLRSL